MDEAAPDEFRVIAELFAPLARGFPGALNLADDAALLAAEPGSDTVITADAMVAGVHFLADDPPDLVARKLLRVNLSDLAAKGARPVAALLTAAFPQATTLDWLRRFAAGLGEDLDRYDFALIGGDTVATPGPLTLSLTLLGRVAAGTALLRSAARDGDTVWVSGTIGDGALGLDAARGVVAGLTDEDAAFLAGRYRLPQPRVALGLRLVGLAHAAMDVSDGLVQDLGHLCRASGVGAVIEAARVPLSAAAGRAVAADQSRLASVLAGGDDYELLFTAPAAAAAAVAALADGAGVPLSAIGRIVAGSGVTVLGDCGRPLHLAREGWRHFGGTMP